MWRVLLKYLTVVENQHFVALDNRVQTMSNCDDCAFRKLLLDQLLNLLFCHDVNVCRGFIKYNDLVLAEDSSANANKLALTGTKVGATFLNLEVDALAFFLVILKAALCSVEIIGRLHA